MKQAWLSLIKWLHRQWFAMEIDDHTKPLLTSSSSPNGAGDSIHGLHVLHKYMYADQASRNGLGVLGIPGFKEWVGSTRDTWLQGMGWEY